MRGRTNERPWTRTEPGTVRLLVSNPDAEVVDTGSAVWAVSAVPDPGVRAVIEAGASDTDLRGLLADSGAEYSFVHVSTDGSCTIHAHRGITSSYEVFFLRASSGEVVVTDLFRDALAHLDPADRTVSKEIVTDHLLYRARPRGTYVEEIERLGHGESLTWTPEAGPPEQSQTESLSRQPTTDRSAWTTALDDALAIATDYDDEVTTMLSGGVDSTLVHTYLPEDTPTASGALDTPEMSHEIEYARQASSHLATDHEFARASESSFTRRIEETIEAIGMPPQQLQAPIIDLCYRGTDHDVYVSGEVADSLYGMGAGAAETVWRTRFLGALPAVHPKLASHHRQLDRLRRSPWDPKSHAQKSSQYVDIDLVNDCVGRSAVEEAQLSRTLYTRSRVPLSDPDGGFPTQLEWGHWIGRLCENTLTAYRQIAQARGVAHRAPFATTEVTRAALSVPTPQRYVSRRESKHIPKRLLGERVPDYDTSKEKGNGNPPARRFLRRGPLTVATERYELPEFANAIGWEEVLDRSYGLGWILLSWAVWAERVLPADIDVTPHTRVTEIRA